MEEDIRLELFTIAEVRDWLVHNQSARGLSEEIMSRTRAWAIINSPYAMDETYIISVLFVNNEVAAYTAVFPEKMARPDRLVYWDTTLYVSPKYEGRGYAAIVIGNILEQYGADFFDHAAADASVANFKFLGLPIYRVPQYIFRQKAISGHGMKALLARTAQKIKDVKRKQTFQTEWKNIANIEYSIKYVDFVDDDTYNFIRAHSEQDAFLRTQTSFNWMLQYGFNRETPLFQRVIKSGQFMSDKIEYAKYAVQVWMGDKLCGFYILVQDQKQSIIKYIYFDSVSEREVFASIFEHLYQHPTPIFVTYQPTLAKYIEETQLYPAKMVYMTSVTTPIGYQFDMKKLVHAGDGDMFS